MDESDFNKIIGDFSISSFSLREKESEKESKKETKTVQNDFYCKTCDVFCKCPENRGLKKKCYYCLWSTTCTGFEMVCVNCTRDLKDCFCKKPVRITKAEFARLYWVTEDNEYFSIKSSSSFSPSFSSFSLRENEK